MREALAAAALFAGALVARALPGAALLADARERLFGYDAYYHLRRILFTLANFPAALSFDRYVQFPEGARPIWPPAFDVALSALIAPFASADDPVRVERLAIWIPPLLGAATVVLAFWIARRPLGFGAALLGAALLAGLSGHVWYSQLGFVDHHVAVALIATGLLGAGMALALRIDGRRGVAGAAVPLGLLMGTLLHVWPGGLLHLGLVQAGLLLIATTRSDAVVARRAALAVCLADAIACALMLPAAFTDWPQWGPYSAVVLTRFQPWLLGLGALHAAVLGAWLGGAGSTRGPTTRTGAAVMLGLAAVAASLLLIPDLRAGWLDAWTWISRDERFQAAVGESLPLFQSPGGLGVGRAELRLSRLLYLLPIALGGLGWRARRAPEGSAIFLLVLFSAGLAIATLAQRRFFNTLSIGLCLASGWLVVELFRHAVGRGGPVRRGLVGAALVLALAFALAPMAPTWSGGVRALRAVAAGAPLELERSEVRIRRDAIAGRWLRDHSPATAGYLSDRAPEYGVLSDWGLGHVLRYEARRPMVVDNFGDDVGPRGLTRMQEYFAAASEREALAVVDGLGVRYVVAEPGPGTEAFRQTLQRGRGQGLSRHRLVYETTAVGSANPPPLRVFEIVPGARLRGRAPARAEVVATRVATRVDADAGLGPSDPGPYQIVGRAEADGRFEIVVPHGDSTYHVASEGQEVSVFVSEQQVQAGAGLEVPTLTLAPRSSRPEPPTLGGASRRP